MIVLPGSNILWNVNYQSYRVCFSLYHLMIKSENLYIFLIMELKLHRSKVLPSFFSPFVWDFLLNFNYR